MHPATHHSFIGAKLALFLGDSLLCLHRDDKPGLLWPGFWDLPGGGNEGEETPLQTAMRETQEEFSIIVPACHIRWGRAYTASNGQASWFFVGWLPDRIVADVTLGDEGQGWDMMTVPQFLEHPKVVPQFKTRLGDYLGSVRSEI